MTLPNREKFITGMTGVYYAAAELSSRGYIVTVTARNAPSVDMMVSTPDLKRTFNVQVKANKPKGTQAYWLLSEQSKMTSPNLIYVFVNLKADGRPDFYLADSSTVSKNLVVERRPGSVFYSFARDGKFKDKWDILK